ncbi:bifunctional nuclease family protein [Amycolatopsis sp. CA-230715]|uniref:bifunctional nuclease family protein n=1 Tax=Amycolatopsis sp. CA-230715 TaxID=2745196 RepID=UPI001C33DA8D|nr:bifunctional nuclease family protein [Amycolatopsis sp. CA-230715]QWF78447.1 hypothetical protein HUW46_01843 [Amycolatopsis sp. CA-230715]
MMLRETEGDQRWLAITIGAPEADALLSAQERVAHPRPGTIELIGQVIDAFGHEVVGVEVTGLSHGIFLSDLVLDSGIRVSARPSDAVALAIRAGVPVTVEEAVLEEASVDIEITGTGAEATADDLSEHERDQQVAEFRALLDEVRPEDFGD